MKWRMENVKVLWDGEHCIFGVVVISENEKLVYKQHYSSGFRLLYLRQVYDSFMAGKFDEFLVYTGTVADIPEFRLEV